ncbi:hypothetical protein LPJ61_004918, partial [Coemansia biformis]
TRELFRSAASAALLLGIRVDPDDKGTGEDAEAWQLFLSESLSGRPALQSWLDECPQVLKTPADWIAAKLADGAQDELECGDVEDGNDDEKNVNDL